MSLDRVIMPGRILKRHVGGNTTYARHVAKGLIDAGVEVKAMPHSARSPHLTLGIESTVGVLPHRSGTVLHYVADTGPVLATRSPSVVTVHGVASRWITTARTPKQEQRWRMRVSRAIGSCDRVVTVSESSRRDVADVFGVPEQDIEVIPHGIDPVIRDGEVKCPSGLEGRADRPYILYLGNIEPRKNLVPLIEAMNDPALGEFDLVIAGKPAWNFKETMAAISASERVVHLGFVSEPERSWLVSRAQAFVFPSLYEGFGLPVVEALAWGTPVICSDRGSLPEVSGPAKLLTDLTADGIAHGVSSALNDSKWLSDIRIEGPKWADTFSWDRSIEAHIRVYREVL